MFLELGRNFDLWLLTLLVALGTHGGVPVLFFSHWPAGNLC